ncbi:MAG: hypothetical protein HYW02_08070 [Deltaproteobacteria bacterium]|nr:hypothetical protein [Deltaproteobacteria bacterium]MBI4196700.1 hypothetical protein [Deltaproteobacteria bacterium]
MSKKTVSSEAPQSYECRFSYYRNSENAEKRVSLRSVEDTNGKSSYRLEVNPAQEGPFTVRMDDKFIAVDGRKLSARSFVNKNENRGNIWITDVTEGLLAKEKATTVTTVAFLQNDQAIEARHVFHPDSPEILASGIIVRCILNAGSAEKQPASVK